MVLGLKTKNRKNASVRVNYLIHVQEIKPWPPSQSLRTLRSVLVQWEYGEKNSGSTKQVVPSLGSSVGDGKIEFNESFWLPVTLLREISNTSGDEDAFQKNCIEFNLYEPRRDKMGQLLGTVVVDLADYGIAKEALSICATMKSKRSFSNTAQPVLFLMIQAFEKSHPASASGDSLLRVASMDRSVGESVLALMDEEYAEEAELASFTDDDVSSHSSLAVSSAIKSNGCSLPQTAVNGSEAMKDCLVEHKDNPVLAPRQGLEKWEEKPMTESFTSLKGSLSSLSSTDLYPDLSFASKYVGRHRIQSSSSSLSDDRTGEDLNTITGNLFHDGLAHDTQQQDLNGGCRSGDISQESTNETLSFRLQGLIASPGIDIRVHEKLGSATAFETQVNGKDLIGMPESKRVHFIQNGYKKDKTIVKYEENGQQKKSLEQNGHYIEDRQYISSSDDTRNQVSLGDDELAGGEENLLFNENSISADRLKHVKSVRSPVDLSKGNGSVRRTLEMLKDTNVQRHAQNGGRSSLTGERKDGKVYSKETKNVFAESKIQQLEHRVKMLEGELREAAAIEVGLYLVIAEHGSSMHKVHAPARRLFRLYTYACKDNFKTSQASAARSALSGLVQVAKACGNDVPRLIFWLSNSVVLRAILSQDFEGRKSQPSAKPVIRRNAKGDKKVSLLKWESSSSKGASGDYQFVDWEDLQTFTAALEKIEAWIFSRIIESIWWQTLTPYMQSATTNPIYKDVVSCSNNTNQKMSCSSDHEPGKNSLGLWKNAFRDACERICPVRAGGHECGCLPVLTKLIMEQCVARLDVAMFNAILRESADEIPTDPVSDPISDAKVLPIPVGKASFGAGAQLKNAIGNWSRWLNDLFDIDNDDLHESRTFPDNSDEDAGQENDTSSKYFLLLNALSDLMMLPKDTLLIKTIGKEVCPTFASPLIRRVAKTFVPDEFCPDPIPQVLLKTLDSQDPFEGAEDSAVDYPCNAASVVYHPPAVSSVSAIIRNTTGLSQLTGSRFLVRKKSNTSDDELDELDSPLTTIILESSQSSPTSEKPIWTSKENATRNAFRYSLLGEVWLNSE